MAKVLLTIKGEQEQRQIGPIKVLALTLGLKKIKDILSVMKEDDKLKEFVAYLSEKKPQQEGDEEEAQEADAEFMERLAGSFDMLLETVPDKVIELLAIVSGVDKAIIEDQEAETLFDIFDAVIAENDIPKLVERAKKSFSNVKGKLGRK